MEAGRSLRTDRGTEACVGLAGPVQASEVGGREAFLVKGRAGGGQPQWRAGGEQEVELGSSSYAG